MAQADLRATLLDRDADAPPELGHDERFLLTHFAALAALLERCVPLQRELCERVQAEGLSDEVRAVAFDAAEKVATVLQPLARRRALVVATQDTPLDASMALAVAEQLFASFTLLAGPADELQELVLTLDHLDDLLDVEGLDDWMREIGAEPPARG